MSGDHADVVEELSSLYAAWAKRCNVMSWSELQELRKQVRDGE